MEIDRYLEQAESILLNGGTFDDERKIFIRNLETCDLIAEQHPARFPEK